LFKLKKEIKLLIDNHPLTSERSSEFAGEIQVYNCDALAMLQSVK